MFYFLGFSANKNLKFRVKLIFSPNFYRQKVNYYTYMIYIVYKINDLIKSDLEKSQKRRKNKKRVNRWYTIAYK